MEQKTQADHVIDLFSGRDAMSKDTKFKYGQIRGWQDSGWIHPRYYREILTEAHRLNVAMASDDFVSFLVADLDAA